MTTNILDSALAYAARGWRVLPLLPLKKTPATRNGHLDATTDEAVIKDWWRQNPYYNIGIATGEVSGITVIDVDGTEGLASSKQVAGVPKTRTIKTPHGYHLYFEYNCEFHTGAGFMPGLDVRNGSIADGGGGYVVAPPSVADGLEYTVYRDMPLATLTVIPDVFKKTHRNGSSSDPDQPTWVSDLLANGTTESTRNDSAIRLAGYFHSKGIPKDVIGTIMEPFARRCTPPFNSREMDAVIASATRYPLAEQERDILAAKLGTNDGRDMGVTKSETSDLAVYRDMGTEESVTSLSALIDAWVRGTKGWFWSRDIDAEFQLRTATEKANRRKIMERLVDNGVIARHDSHQGQYRFINSKVKRIDFKATPVGNPIDIEWPLEIESIVELYPRELAVIAGYSNAGKTALMYNIIRMNMHKPMPIYYFCREAPQTLRKRLSMFDGDIQDWNFEAIDQQENYPDVVVPNAINIIDYLSVEDLTTIQTKLEDIIAAVGDGVAIVAIQKKGYAELGYGAEYTLAPASIYLSMNKGRIRVVKGKHWANPNRNPDGLERRFDIEYGSKFVPLQFEWDYPPKEDK